MHFEEHIHTCTYRHEDMRMRGCCIFRGNCYIYVHMYIAMCICGGAAFQSSCESLCIALYIGSLKLQVSFAKDPYKRDYIMQKRPMNLRSLLIEATPYVSSHIVCIFSHHVYLLTLSCSTPPPSILLLSADVCRMSESRVYSAAWCYVCRVLEKSIVYCVCGRCV